MTKKRRFAENGEDGSPRMSSGVKTLSSRSSLQNQRYARCSSTSWANLRSERRPYQYPRISIWIMSSGSIDGRATLPGRGRAAGGRKRSYLASQRNRPTAVAWRRGRRRWPSKRGSGRRDNPSPASENLARSCAFSAPKVQVPRFHLGYYKPKKLIFVILFNTLEENEDCL
jgi:hypothetical protein